VSGGSLILHQNQSPVTTQEQERVKYLLERVRNGQSTSEECQELLDVVAEHPSEEVVPRLNEFFSAASAPETPFDRSQWMSTLQQVLAADKMSEPARVNPTQGCSHCICSAYGGCAYLLFQSVPHTQIAE
jgi:hypothetical protein